MNNNYDIIIVGAGPAGSSAALYAQKLGLKTILLDKATFPRDKICGDALSGKSVRYMKELNIINEMPKLNGSLIKRITFGSPTHKQFDIDLSGSKNKDKIKEGFVIPRKIFDNFLFNKAKNVTETKEGFKVTDIIYKNKKIIGVEGVRDKQKEKIYAPIIFGCDGPNSIISRKLGFHDEDESNTAIAIRCYYKDVKGLSDQIELHFVDEVLPGYFWMFPAGDNVANIGIGLSKKEAKKDKRKLTEILNDVIKSDYFKDRFYESEKMENPKGWSLPLGRVIRPSYGDGFMLLGDAAGLVDPFTGEGIGNAMESGRIAAKTASIAKEINNFSKEHLKSYDQELWGYLGNELNTSTRLLKLAHSKFLLNFVINRAARNEKVRNIMSGMLADEIPKTELSNPLFYLKILFS